MFFNVTTVNMSVETAFVVNAMQSDITPSSLVALSEVKSTIFPKMGSSVRFFSACRDASIFSQIINHHMFSASKDACIREKKGVIAGIVRRSGSEKPILQGVFKGHVASRQIKKTELGMHVGCEACDTGRERQCMY